MLDLSQPLCAAQSVLPGGQDRLPSARGHAKDTPSLNQVFSDPPEAAAHQSQQSRSIIPSKPTTVPMPTSERARPGDRGSDPHTHSARSSRDQNCVRRCCQPFTTPCARALPSSKVNSHDENCTRFALEQKPTSGQHLPCGRPLKTRFWPQLTTIAASE